MKIIEAMKKVKENKVKIQDLRHKIAAHSAHCSHETPVYPDIKEKIISWAQSCEDLNQDNIRLLLAIQKTNLVTMVPIKAFDQTVTKSIAEWVWRKREYSAIDKLIWESMTDRGLKEGHIPSSTGISVEVKIVRNYDPELRDKKITMYKSEPFLIDAALEVVNATTDLVE